MLVKVQRQMEDLTKSKSLFGKNNSIIKSNKIY